MVLRMIEMILPEKEKERLEKVLTNNNLPILGIWIEPMLGIWGRPVGGIWKKSFDEDLILVKLLVSTEYSESVIDHLEKNFHKVVGCRMVVLPVAASLPRLEVEEKAQETSDEEKKAKSKRISREELYSDIAYKTRLSNIYVFMIILSSIVAAIGVLGDNVAVIIGAMVIAPLLGPNVAFSLATILGDAKLARSALKANFVGIFTAMAISFALGAALPVNPETPEIASRTVVGLGEVALALASGSAGALAFTTGVSATLIGVMVAVALLPPLVTFGLLMGSGHEALAWGAMLLFVTNFICVNLSGVATFLAQGIRPLGWLEAKKAKRNSLVAIALWIVMLVALVVIILRWGAV